MEDEIVEHSVLRCHKTYQNAHVKGKIMRHIHLFSEWPQVELGAIVRDQAAWLRWQIQHSPSLSKWVALVQPTAAKQKIMLEAVLRRKVLWPCAAGYEARYESITSSGQPGDPYTRCLGWVP